MARTPEDRYRRELRKLSDLIQNYLILVDDAMKLPPPERGPRLADLSNKLEMRNDMVRRFVLEVTKSGRPLKSKSTATGNARAEP